ncbi:two-component sensor [Pandoraea terrae]|uniref:histidine kinase n=1 Tax=Pandoraea terrae TaxID=1537710 RepID=A0A5E4V5F2_9BURK|nr:HAMP domain-containing sensor histidine kinase [Pandoraea terrae]VVE06784.1 two-component sensor [Pandoraea terrae]
MALVTFFARLRELPRTSSFRLAVLFLGLFGLVSLGLCAYLYISISGFAMQSVDDWLLREQAGIRRVAPDRLRAALDEKARVDTLQRRPFGLFDAGGARLAGGFPGVQPVIPSLDKPFSTKVTIHGHRVPLRCIATALPSQQLVLQCQDVHDVGHFNEQLREVLVSVGVATLLVWLGCAAFVAASAMRRIDAVTDSIRDIMTGDLGRRLPVSGQRNDIDRLAAVVNGMLDHIERLMDEVRGVCDAIAHDLRTPLTRLRAGLERAQRNTSSVEQQRAVIEDAIEQTSELLRTFNALLRIAEVEGDARRAGFVPVDLRGITDDVIEFYQPTAEEKGISLDYQRPAEPVRMAAGDPSLLFEAISNVLDNAIKFAPPGGRVSLALTGTADGFCMAVRDNGPGIPPDERARVFRRFHRTESSRSTPGSGLGLSVAQAIARMHGMSIGITDESPGCTVALASGTR